MQPLRKDPILRKMNVCAHFTGVQHDRCRVGVPYEFVKEGKTFACFQDEANGLVCEKAHFPTREEAEIEKKADDVAYERHRRAHRAVHDDAKAKGLGRGHGGEGVLVCPLCQGSLVYSVASYNGHIHARCRTEGCVSWME